MSRSVQIASTSFLSFRIPSGSVSFGSALELRMSENKFFAPRSALLPVFGAGWNFSRIASALSTPVRKNLRFLFPSVSHVASGVAAFCTVKEPQRLANLPPSRQPPSEKFLNYFFSRVPRCFRRCRLLYRERAAEISRPRPTGQPGLWKIFGEPEFFRLNVFEMSIFIGLFG